MERNTEGKMEKCKGCINYIYSMKREKMICTCDKKFSDECHVTEIENILQTYKRKKIDNKYNIYINGEKRNMTLKEMLYDEKRKRYKFLIDIDKICESIVFSIRFSVGGDVILMGYEKNDLYGNDIKIYITKHKRLIEDLRKHTGGNTPL